MDKKQYNYIGRLFVNKSKAGATYLKGSINIDGKDIKVIAFPNELELKTGEKVKTFSLALAEDDIKQPKVEKKVAVIKPNNDDNTDF